MAAKSANLGEVMHARLPGIDRTAGLSPFPFLLRRVPQSRMTLTTRSLAKMLNDQKFVHDPAYRRQRLKELRERLQQGKIDGAIASSRC